MSSTTPHRLRLIVILGALTAVGPLTIDMYLPSFPSVARDLGGTVAAVQLTLATYLAGLAIGQLAYGPLADRFGRRPPLLGGLALYSAASIACAAAPSIPLLAAARFVQALGGCAGLVISRAVVRDRFDVTESSRVYASLMLIMGAAPILAPLAGGQVLAVGGWRAIFLVLAATGAAMLAVVALGLGETLPRERRISLRAREVLGGFAAALRQGSFVRLSLAGGAIQAAMFAYIAGSPFVFIELHGVAPSRFGFIFGANAAGIIGASQLSRAFARRFGVRRSLRVAVLGALVAYAVLLYAAVSGAGLALLWPPLFLGVASYGLVAPNATAAAMGVIDRQVGSASAVMGVLQSACGALASTAVSALADGTARPMAAIMFGCALAAVLLVELERVRQR